VLLRKARSCAGFRPLSPFASGGRWEDYGNGRAWTRRFRQSVAERRGRCACDAGGNGGCGCACGCTAGAVKAAVAWQADCVLRNTATCLTTYHVSLPCFPFHLVLSISTGAAKRSAGRAADVSLALPGGTFLRVNVRQRRAVNCITGLRLPFVGVAFLLLFPCAAGAVVDSLRAGMRAQARWAACHTWLRSWTGADMPRSGRTRYSLL